MIQMESSQLKPNCLTYYKIYCFKVFISDILIRNKSEFKFVGLCQRETKWKTNIKEKNHKYNSVQSLADMNWLIKKKITSVYCKQRYFSQGHTPALRNRLVGMQQTIKQKL